MRARIGFLHHRHTIHLQLPKGTQVLGSDGTNLLEAHHFNENSTDSTESYTRFKIQLDHQRPGQTTPCLKILESSQAAYLEEAETLLHDVGMPFIRVPFAPGGQWGKIVSPATWLLVCPLKTTAQHPLETSSHMKRDLGSPGDLQQLQDIKKILGALRAQESDLLSLWHTESVALFHCSTKSATSFFSLSLSSTGTSSTADSSGLWATHHKTEKSKKIDSSDVIVLAKNLQTLRVLVPPGKSARVEEVEVGIGFHWNHRCTLHYRDCLEVFQDSSGLLGLLNELEAEDYLAAVNSSEMTPDSPLALLEAQTICARSTFLATRGRHHSSEAFDLCADDHCQCFRGCATLEEKSIEAARNTNDLVLTWKLIDSKTSFICDSRYSKSCGGIVEAYEHVWESRDLPWLRSLPDLRTTCDQPRRGSTEEEWQQWIDRDEDAWCNTDRASLPKGLASCEGRYRWQTSYQRDDLAMIIAKKTGLDFTKLLRLTPAGRGESGRLIALDVITDAGQFRIGRELAIRLALSEDCLYSAAIYFDDRGDQITIHGKGWGHGVGMCQLGATRMAAEGFSYQKILAHYFPGSRIQSIERHS